MKPTALLMCFAFALLQASCGTGVDPNGAYGTVAPTCSGIVAASPWTAGIKQFGEATKSTTVYALAFDSSGNLYATGAAQGTIDGTNYGNQQAMFLIKYAPNGAVLWTRGLGSTSSTVNSEKGIAIDSSGNIYVATAVSGAGLDGNTLAGAGADVVLVKYDSSGNKIWLRQFGAASGGSAAYGVAVDSSSNAYIGGYTFGALGGNTVNVGAVNGFVAKYNSEGTQQWVKTLSATTAVEVSFLGIGVDSAGKIYVTGNSQGTVGGVAKTGTNDALLAQYDSSGTLQWIKLLGVATKSSLTRGVVADTAGNIYIGGRTNGGLDGNTLTGVGDYFVAKYDNTGTRLWVKQAGVATKGADVYAMAADPSGGVYLAGETTGGLGGNTLTGTADAWFAKYDATGALQSTQLLGTAAKTTSGKAVAVNCASSVAIGGYTSGALPGATLTGSADGFVALYGSTGTRL